MKRYLLFFIALTLCSACLAQSGVRRWTLEECMRYAVENSPRTAQQQARNRILKQNYAEAILSLLPSVSAGTSASYNFGRALGDDNTYSSLNTFSNNYQVSGQMTIFAGLSYVNRIRMEKMNRLSGQHKLTFEQDMIAYETMEAFHNLVYYKEMVRLAQEQLEESQRSLQQIERMAELGLKGFPDVAEIRAKEAEDRYNLTRQKNQHTIGVILLKEKMNLPVEEQIEIEDETFNDTVLSAGVRALDIFDRSLMINPKALSAAADLKASELSFKMVRGRMLPTLSMSGGVSTNFFKPRDGSDYATFRDQFKDKRGEYFGFSLSVPIFDGFYRRSNKRRSQYELEIARSQHDQTLRELYTEIEQTVADVNGQADEYIQAYRQVEAMKVAQDVNRSKFEQGLISALDLRTSTNRLLDARIKLKRAQLLYRLKNRLLEYYKGVPFFVPAQTAEE